MSQYKYWFPFSLRALWFRVRNCGLQSMLAESRLNETGDGTLDTQLARWTLRRPANRAHASDKAATGRRRGRASYGIINRFSADIQATGPP